MANGMKLSILKAFLGVLALCVFQMNAFSRFILNSTSEGFAESDQPAIEGYVIEGAGYFLKSYSDLLLLMNKIELSDMYGVDYAELQQLVNSALSNMENSREKYTSLTQIADKAPYKQTVIAQLTAFDYNSFGQAKELNGVITGKMETYLGFGDVRGIYHKILTDTQAIIDKLIIVRSAVDTGILPVTSDLWRLNESYLDTLFLGQYAAEIFYNITGKN